MQISVNLDVSKIDKKRLYQGQKGTYLNAIIFMNDQPDQYGNNGMIVESITKEERDAGKRGTILGNVKIIGGKPTRNYADGTTNEELQSSRYGSTNSDQDDLPF